MDKIWMLAVCICRNWLQLLSNAGVNTWMENARCTMACSWPQVIKSPTTIRAALLQVLTLSLLPIIHSSSKQRVPMEDPCPLKKAASKFRSTSLLRQTSKPDHPLLPSILTDLDGFFGVHLWSFMKLTQWHVGAQAGQGPLNTPSFTSVNPDGVIDIPASAFVTIDASGPDVLLTAQLTGASTLQSSPSAPASLAAELLCAFHKRIPYHTTAPESN